MRPNPYSFDNYREVLKKFLNADEKMRGMQARLSECLRCQSPFISHVLAGRNDFSLEQAEAAARFFSFSDDETEYFLELLSFNRAATVDLKTHFRKKLDRLRKEHFELQKRVKLDQKISFEEQARYYQSWEVAAIHIAVTIPQLQYPHKISEKLGIKETKVTKILQFLESKNFVKKSGTRYLPQNYQLHLGKSSPFLYQHHRNWRLASIDYLDTSYPNDVRYSGTFSCSKKDLPWFQEELTLLIQKFLERAKVSSEEHLCGLCLDFFRMD